MKFNSKLYLIGTLLCLMAGQSYAQFSQRDWDRAAYLNWLAYHKAKDNGDNLIKWWRQEGTLGISLAGPLQIEVQSVYVPTINSTRPAFDTMMKISARPTVGFHLNENANYMISRLGRGSSSILAISVGAQGDYLRWQYELTNESTAASEKKEAYYLQIGLPITIDYKWGCDVDFLPDMKTCFAAGAGVLPMIGIADDGMDHGGGKAAIIPYMYASYGMYTGGFFGCVKLRASFTPGKLKLIDNYGAQHGDATINANAYTSNVFSIGIAIMAYSGDWRDGWARRGAGSSGRTHYHRHSGGTTRMF